MKSFIFVSSLVFTFGVFFSECRRTEFSRRSRTEVKKIQGPKWMYEGKGGEFTCPNPGRERRGFKTRKVIWYINGQRWLDYSIRRGKAKINMDARSNDFVVNRRPSSPYVLSLANVTLNLDGKEIVCVVKPRGRSSTNYSYGTTFKVIRGNGPRIHRDSLDAEPGELTDITCESPNIESQLTLYIDSEVPPPRQLDRSVDRATGIQYIRYRWDPEEHRRLYQPMLSVECEDYYEGYRVMDYASFSIAPQYRDGGHWLAIASVDEGVTSSAESAVTRMIGTSLLLGATAVCLRV